MINEHVKVNKIDHDAVLSIGEKIKKYEDDTNEKITNIILAFMGSNEEIFWDQIKVKSQLTYSSLYHFSSANSLINVELDKNYSYKIISKQDYEKILKQNNLKDDKIIFYNNSILIKVYDW